MADVTLVDIASALPDAIIDIRYATDDNFTGKPVYAKPRALLHPAAMEKLVTAAEIARRLGYRLRIFDAFRPAEAQQKLWNHTPDPDFLCPPDIGSPHSRGVAVDLTLVDGQGNDLDMGTGFDAFTPLSHHGNDGVSLEAQKNRLLLMGMMTTAGWDFYRNEWWHYQLFNSRRDYVVLSDADAQTGMM
ncbi:D-alanyl-D-alanine dipeptidase [bacterium]|nr:D-alanyl-D-alanine dipeptidase [bacterium]